MADREILKAQIAGYKAKLKEWLDVEVYGYKRGRILLAVIVVVAAVLTAS